MNVFGDLFSPSKPPRPPNTSADVSYDSKSDLDSDFTLAKKNPFVVEGLDENFRRTLERARLFNSHRVPHVRVFSCPTDDPLRFRVEIMLSNGVCLDPFAADVCESFRRSNALENEGLVEPTPVLDRVQLQNDSVCEDEQPYLTLDTLESISEWISDAKPEKKHKKENVEQQQSRRGA